MIDEDVMFNLLGNETRRMILKMLSLGPCYTTEIAEKLNIGQKAINEHMRLLQEAGIVDLYVQKQSRGSPRKYFKINKRIRLEFAMGPYSYTTVSNDALDADISELPDEFPEFKEIMKEVNKARKIKEISMLSKTLGNLRIEHERLTKAKEYVESMIGHVKLQCINVCDEMGLDDSEKRLVLELIGAGGKLSIGDLSDRLKVDENEITDSLKKLKVKGIIKS
ncbi:MAG TPA: ArsR family transcriptional regulator [Candidatus Methanofastidiosa archaeon]|nr:ArsR family transcriptional regulator [Candidatus Methanofastidiosa archaeon]